MPQLQALSCELVGASRLRTAHDAAAVAPELPHPQVVDVEEEDVRARDSQELRHSAQYGDAVELFGEEQVARARRYHRPLYAAALAQLGLDVLLLALIVFGPLGELALRAGRRMALVGAGRRVHGADRGAD